MAGRDVADRAIESYLDAVAARLVGPRAARAAIIDELRDGLHEAVAVRTRGGNMAAAVTAALDEFGAPAATAAAFAEELACSRARRTVSAYLSTGPLVGLPWLLLLAPSGWWHQGPAGLWTAVPPTLAIGLAVPAGILVLAATGRASRWLLLPARHLVHGALIVVAAAVLGDLVLLYLATQSAATSPTIGALAVTASAVRLGCSISATGRCFRTRRSFTHVEAIRKIG